MAVMSVPIVRLSSESSCDPTRSTTHVEIVPRSSIDGKNTENSCWA